MQLTIDKFKQHQVLYVNILFTIFCVFSTLAIGFEFVWYLMWLIVPIFMPTDKSIHCIMYMSLYMRVTYSVELFSSIICLSIFIVLIKELIYLNKNKLINKYFKIIIFYLILIIFPLFYSIILNKCINISFIYYLNVVNFLFLFYLLKNKLNYNIILTYSYGIITASVLSFVMYSAGLYHFPFHAGGRFCAFSPVCNTLGASCAICIASIYVLWLNKKLKSSHTLLLITALSLIGIITFSKTFFIIFSITLLTIFINQFKNCKNKKRLLTICLFALIILSPFILYYGVIMFERFFGDTSYSNIIDRLTTGRLDKWIIYIKPWAKNLYSILFGLGFGYDYNTIFSSHSFYVGYLSKMGIIGFAILLLFVYSTVLRKNNGNFKLKYLPIILILLICIVEDLSYNTFNFIPFALATICINQHTDTQI